MPNIQPAFRFSKDCARRHLEHLFGGDLDGRHDGWIELRMLGPRNGADAPVRHFYFGTDELDELVDKAAEINAQAGWSAYIGAALREPDMVPFEAAKDENFYAATCAYVDIDKEGAADRARELFEITGQYPTAWVITASEPWTRVQLWFRLVEPITDAAEYRALMRAMALALGGDTTVANPSRIMRLGGSINWAKKPGRKTEVTKFTTKADRPQRWAAELLRKHVEIAPPETRTAADAGSDAPRHAVSGNIKLRQTLDRTREAGAWHPNMLAAVGSMVGLGWGDEQIRLACAAYCDQGADDPDLTPMIAGARQKLSRPDPAYTPVDETAAPAPGFQLADWAVERFAPGQAPPIQWLAEGVLALGEPVLLAGMGGIGKSYLELDMALNIALGVTGVAPQRALGGVIQAHGSVVMLSAEDAAASIHRRLDKIDPQGRRMQAQGRLIVVPMPDAGGARAIIAGSPQGAVKTPFFEELREQLRAIDDLKLVIVDPLSAFVSADVSADNAAAQFMWSSLAEICAEKGATVMVTHHLRKDGMNRIRTGEDARESIRGVTALVDGARRAFVLWKVEEEEAQAICTHLGLDYQPARVVRGAVVKANDEADWTTKTFVRNAAGLLEECVEDIASDAIRAAAALAPEMVDAILKDINHKWVAGEPYSNAVQSPRYVLPMMLRHTDGRRKECRDLLSDWFQNGMVVSEIYDRKTKAQGLRVAFWPGLVGGS